VYKKVLIERYFALKKTHLRFTIKARNRMWNIRVIPNRIWRVLNIGCNA
jgi:hypothetical protein